MSAKLSSALCLLGTATLRASACEDNDPKLGAGWKCYTDTATNHDYYYCGSTKVTTWNIGDTTAACGDAQPDDIGATTTAAPDGDDTTSGGNGRVDGPCIRDGAKPTATDACEGYNYGKDDCNNVGCCTYTDGECWANIAIGEGKCDNWNADYASTTCKKDKDGNPIMPNTVSHKMLGTHLENACHTNQDYKVWTDDHGEQKFDDDLARAGKKCWGESSCVRDAIMDRRGYTKDCATCFGDVSVCTVLHCWADCMAGERAKCTDCNKDRCAPGFIKCSGIPKNEIHAGVAIHSRRLSGLAAKMNATAPPVLV